MSRSLFFLCIACFTVFARGYAQPIVPQLDKRVMIMENPPMAACHASTIVDLGKGKLMAAWFGGSREGNKDVTIWTALNENGKWSEIKEITNGVINDTLRYPCWNPVLFKTKAGKLFLYYKVGPNPRQWWGMMMSSTNNGKTWSAPEKLPEGMLGPIKNKPLQLSNGDILYPSSTESHDNQKWHIHLERSDRNGRNWSRVEINNDTFGVIQPSILRYPHDSLQLLCRSRNNVVVQAWSGDNGNTWGPLSPTDLPNPNAGTDALTLANGLKVIVYNPLLPGVQWWEGRSRLYVAVSEDGAAWQNVFALEDEKTGEYSYPAVIQSPDGRVHITYTADRKNIRHVVLLINRPEKPAKPAETPPEEE
ncbi:sialidase family protein [Chitinophaga barathri]|uniref:Sialidase n=1 Tax=Chitinophaga barathri TaxID=1647451 RepID=A0A3N4MJE5_9BACT|nr:sialidase family protein [Chitinophaga barathri]RPD41967.1 sialidase [Chitinophaga barathri]